VHPVVSAACCVYMNIEVLLDLDVRYFIGVIM